MGLLVWWRTVSCHVGKIMGPSLNCLSMHGCRCDSLKVYLAVCWLSTRQSILEIQVMRYQWWIFDWGDQKWGKIMKLRSWISSLHRADYDTKRVYQIHRTVDSRVHITGCNGLKQRVVFLIAEHATLVMTVSNKGHSFQPVSFRKNQKKCFLSEIAIPINRHVINVMRDPLA